MSVLGILQEALKFNTYTVVIVCIVNEGASTPLRGVFVTGRESLTGKFR